MGWKEKVIPNSNRLKFMAFLAMRSENDHSTRLLHDTKIVTLLKISRLGYIAHQHRAIIYQQTQTVHLRQL